MVQTVNNQSAMQETQIQSLGQEDSLEKEMATHSEEGNRQNRLHLESRTPSWAGLWTLSYMPSIYGNDIPTGKPGPRKEEPQCFPSPIKIP